jgi:hypothetical protein
MPLGPGLPVFRHGGRGFGDGGRRSIRKHTRPTRLPPGGRPNMRRPPLDEYFGAVGQLKGQAAAA